MTRTATRAVLVAVLLGGVGCGSTAARSDAAPDAGDASAHDGGADALDGGACNAIDQLADPVTTSCDPGAPPAATGGTITDGTYVLTESHFFGNCDSSVLSETLVVSAGTVQTVQSITTDATTGLATRRNFTVAATGGSHTTLTETETCPAVANVVTNVGFTATATRLTIRMSNALGSRVSTFTLQ